MSYHEQMTKVLEDNVRREQRFVDDCVAVGGDPKFLMKDLKSAQRKLAAHFKVGGVK